MKCPNCYKEIGNDFKFCPYCATRTTIAQKCPHCGSTNLPIDSKFCPDCGKNIKFKEEEYNIKKNDLTFTVSFITFKMIYVEGGMFRMGSEDNDIYSDRNEKPAHDVELSPYYIGETPVIQALWEEVMGNKPGYDRPYNYPVFSVSWNDCQIFLKKLNNITGKHFRLLTEAEWEFAAIGGCNRAQKDLSRTHKSDELHSVKANTPNALGIYDMAENVQEWCEDWYDVYSSNKQINPTGPNKGERKVIRGYYGVKFRNYSEPNGGYHIGFRIALSV